MLLTTIYFGYYKYLYSKKLKYKYFNKRLNAKSDILVYVSVDDSFDMSI